MRQHLFLGLLFLINAANGLDCDGGGVLSYSASDCITPPNSAPSCVWVQNNLDAVCSSTLTNSDIVKVDDTCYVNGGTCSQVSGFSDTPYMFCCTSGTVESISSSASQSVSTKNTPVAQISSLASASVQKSATATATCPYRVYNAAADFSGTQGRYGWYYGYYNGGTYTQFTNYAYSSVGSLGSVSSWNYNVNSNGNIGSAMIMPNGAGACNTASYGNIAPVLRWYNPTGSCYQDVTITFSINHGSSGGGIVAGLTVNGNSVYSNSAGGALVYSGTINAFGVNSVELSIGPLNNICDYGQTSYTLNIAPIGQSGTTVASISGSASPVRSVSPKASSSNIVTSSNTVSPKVSGSGRFSATATATVFYSGNWTDYGAVYWNIPLSNTAAETISECMIRCSLNPLCGGISVNTPCYNIQLNSPDIYTTTCSNCFTIPIDGTNSGVFVPNAGWESFILYDKMFPSTESARASSTPTRSALVSSSARASLSFSRSPLASSSNVATSTNSGSVSVSKSPSLTSSLSRSPRVSGSSSLSATATATEFYTGNWTDLGPYNYALGDIANLGSMTINRCMVNCFMNPLCGLVVVTSPCNSIPLDSPLVHTSVCGECWLKLTSGWVISPDTVSRSIMLYDRVYPPTATSRGSLSSSASPLPTSSLILYSSYDMCASSGTTITLPVTGSAVTLRTNAIGGQYANSANCNFYINGGTGKRFVFTYQSFNTEACCDPLTVYNAAGSLAFRDVGVIATDTIRYVSDTSSIRVAFTTDGSVINAGVIVKIELQDIPLSVTAPGTYSYSPSRSASVSSRDLGTLTVSIYDTISNMGTYSTHDSGSPSVSSFGTYSTSYSAVSRNTISPSKSPSFSQSSTQTSSSSPSPFVSTTPINSFYSSISSDGSSSWWVSYSSSSSGSVSSNSSYSICYSESKSPEHSTSPNYTQKASFSVGPSPTPLSFTARSSISISPSYSIAPTVTPSSSASNVKPAGPPPALPANLSSLSLDALGGLFNDMANYPPAFIGENLQKLGMAALANSPGGEFGISTSAFNVKIKALPPDTGNGSTSSVPLSVGKTGISMPKVAGAAAASAIQWTSDPYNSAVTPDSMVLSLNVLDSLGTKVEVKNSSVPIIIKMNLVPSVDDPRFLPLPSYLADCTKGEIYKKSGNQFLDASAIVNSTGYHKWSVPCLLDDWRSMNCSSSDNVLRYTCPPLIYTPKCQYWDSNLGTWSTDGCVPTFSNATLMICSCTHLTDFSSRINAVAQGNKAIFENAGNVYSLDGLIKFAQWYGIFGGIGLLTMLLGYVAVIIDRKGTRAYVNELLHNKSINLFLAHNPDTPIFSYDASSKYSKALKNKTKEKHLNVKPTDSDVKRVNFCSRIFLQHTRLQFIFKYDPRLSRVFRLLFLFTLQFHSLFVTALMYNFTYNGTPMMWYDTILLSLITTGLNMPVVRLIITSMNKIGMLEFQAQFPLLYEEYKRRLDFELYAMYYIFNSPDGDENSTDAGSKNNMALLEDDDLSIFDIIAMYMCNKPAPVSKKEELSVMSHKEIMKTMVNIVKEPYPYYDTFPVGWQNAPCHTFQGGVFILACCGWLGWCLNYLLLFAAAHENKVGETIMTSYATSEISTIFLVQPLSIMLTTLVYYLVKRYEKHLPNFIKNIFMVRKIKSIPSIFYFSDPWNKKSKSPFTSEFAYSIFVACPAAASGTNELAYAPISAVAEVIDGSETNRMSEVLILYRRILHVWDEIKRAPTPKNSIVLRSIDSPFAWR